MMNRGSLLVAVVLVALIHSGSAAEKLASCCKLVNSQEIKEPITGYLVQKQNLPCVRAVIFQTEKGLFCSQLNAPWVLPKIRAFEKARARTTPSPVVRSSTASLLSILTSTASPPSSSTPPSSSSLEPSSTIPSSSSPPPSFPSTSEAPAGESFSESSDE